MKVVSSAGDGLDGGRLLVGWELDDIQAGLVDTQLLFRFFVRFARFQGIGFKSSRTDRTRRIEGFEDIFGLA